MVLVLVLKWVKCVLRCSLFIFHLSALHLIASRTCQTSKAEWVIALPLAWLLPVAVAGLHAGYTYALFSIKPKWCRIKKYLKIRSRRSIALHFPSANATQIRPRGTSLPIFCTKNFVHFSGYIFCWLGHRKMSMYYPSFHVKERYKEGLRYTMICVKDSNLFFWWLGHLKMSLYLLFY